MLSQWLRLLKDTDDISLANQSSETIAVDGSDHLLLGKVAAFNNFYMDFSVVNTDSTVMTIDYWNGSGWKSGVDILDGTKGATQNGVVQFSPNKDYGWRKICDTSDSSSPSEVSGFTIYDLYWVRIGFTNPLSAGSLLNSISYKFTTDTELLLKDSDINEFLTSFGVTDWTSQIRAASIEVATDFKRKKLISNEGQILRFDDVFLPTTYKTLFNIYLNLGESYKDRRKEISDLYEKSFAGLYTIDQNNDGVVSKQESGVSSNRMFR